MATKSQSSACSRLSSERSLAAQAFLATIFAAENSDKGMSWGVPLVPSSRRFDTSYRQSSTTLSLESRRDRISSHCCALGPDCLQAETIVPHRFALQSS